MTPKTSLKHVKDRALEESQNKKLIQSEKRQKELGEVFTPTPLVLQILNKLPKNVWQEDKTFLDPSCGNGQFLAVVLMMKLHLGHKNPIDTIYGVDIMQDNVEATRARLLKIAGNTKRNRKVVERNIVCHDGLTYDYEFGRKQEEESAKKDEEFLKSLEK